MKLVRLLLIVMVLSATASAYASNFNDNGNGTISDANTGLVWQKDDDGTTPSWTAALTYCEGLSLAGQTDWRLPNRMELISIVDYTQINPSINTMYFPSSKSSGYWSSTSNAFNAFAAWYVLFSYGNVEFYGKTNSYYVRCVRGGQ